MSETTEAIKAARNLREIKRLYRELGSQIIADGISRDIADSDALNFLGPVAKDSQWEAAYDAAEALADVRDETFVDYAGDQLGENHPLGVLTYWEDLIRMERDQPTSLKATVNRGADYLRDRADWMFGETDGEANFIGCMQFAADIKQCRAALENVLHDGVRPDRTETPCEVDDCPNLLVKIYGPTVTADCYVCPLHKHPFTYPEYVGIRQRHMWSARADDAWIAISDAAKSLGRSQWTIRCWLKPRTRGGEPIEGPRVRHRRVGPMERIEVYWPDVRDTDAEAKRRLILRRADIA